ncbi:MAG: phosphotransferase [Dermabacter sp.]|nr:phosphotransferase [Dermabacter sp.]
MSWGLIDTRVLHVRAGGRDLIVKAAGPANHHIGREITAHESWTAPLVRAGRAGALVAASREANVLVVEYQEGELVEDTPAEFEAATYRQAGQALGLLHAEAARGDDTYVARAKDRALAWLDGDHRIDARAEAAARRVLASAHSAPVTVVPTHGDFHPRNWLVDGSEVRIIDFGRFAHRSASSDLLRLATQQWHLDPALEAAFFAGYGEDPRDPALWDLELLCEAIGVAAWAYRVGDEDFEARGHAQIADALARM